MNDIKFNLSLLDNDEQSEIYHNIVNNLISRFEITSVITDDTFEGIINDNLKTIYNERNERTHKSRIPEE